MSLTDPVGHLILAWLTPVVVSCVSPAWVSNSDPGGNHRGTRRPGGTCPQNGHGRTVWCCCQSAETIDQHRRTTVQHDSQSADCAVDTADNNFAERQIRPALQAPALVAFSLRKNSQSNRSDRGAATQAIFMSVYRTLRLRGLDPTEAITNAVGWSVRFGRSRFIYSTVNDRSSEAVERSPRPS